MSKRFETGRVVCTVGVHELKEENREFAEFVNKSFMRYIIGDWGDTCKEDAKLNTYAIECDRDQRIHAVYKQGEWRIWITTEWDRSVTTILFPEEY